MDNIFFHNTNIKTASLYYPINNEIEPFEFVKYFEYKNIIMSMPVVDMIKKSMLFRKWSPNDKLRVGPLGNLEPTLDKDIIFPQIMIVPMLMFDRQLFRLGYGGGYYDKSIFNLKKFFQKLLAKGDQVLEILKIFQGQKVNFKTSLKFTSKRVRGAKS